MKTLKRIRYNTMNSWNNSTSLAYNLKIYNVIDNKLQGTVYKLFDKQDFDLIYGINDAIEEFNTKFNFEWQAGFNGRSGGYIVLYKGGIKDNKPFSYPGKNVYLEEVPVKVRKAFRQLAINIVKLTEIRAKEFESEDADG